MRISLIVALDECGGIGRQGGLPWHLSADLRRFKALTMGHHIVMGRKTWESIGRALPGRFSIVITHQTDYHAPGALVEHSLAAGLELARAGEKQEIFIIGGAEIFAAALPVATRIYLTRVHTCIQGADAFFPELPPEAWKLVEANQIPADEQNEYTTTFQIYDRIHN